MPEKTTFKKDELKMPQEHFGAQELLAERPSYFGIILSVLIVVLMCILGGLYAWSELILKNKALENETPIPTRPTKEENNEPESTTAEAQVETLGAMSTSDEIDTIEADLEATTMSDEVFEAELVSVEAELAE